MHRGTIRLSVLLAICAFSVCLFSAGLTVIRAGDAGRTGRLMYHGRVYSVGIGKNTVNVYSKAGERLCGYVTGSGDNMIFSSCVSDLDADAADEILLIVGQEKNEYGSYLEILKAGSAPLNGRNGVNADGTGRDRTDIDRADDSGGQLQDLAGLKRIYRFDMKEINPWKVQTCDVDGDGTKEISVGVYKTAIFHPVMAKRPFIYNWTDNHLSPKWLGSRLSRPFDDYIFSDVDSDGRDELVSTEILADGRKTVNVYAWKGFGFESIGGSAGYDNILEIRTAPGGEIAVNTTVNGQSEWVKLRYENGALSNSK